MKENKKYNAIDFARYYSGAMPPDEMHALEKAALEDPFLADALDGYAYTKSPEKELDEIRMRLDEKRKQKNIFSISSFTQNNWWKIAAMVIIIAGAGYFFFFINFQKENSLAIKEDAIKKEKSDIVSRIKEDTAASDGNVAFEKTSKERMNAGKPAAPTIKSAQTPMPDSRVQEEKKIAKEKNLSQEYLADKKDKAAAMNRDKSRSADLIIADSEDRSFFRSSDTSALVAASPKSNFEDSLNTVALNSKKPSLQEVAINGYGTKRKKSITGAVSERVEGKASGVEVSSASPYPKEGKEKFDQYIKDNATAITDSAGNSISVNILLSFTLNEKSKPVHIKVLESSCKPCETEAIRLLKNGPEWTGKAGTPGTVRIQF